MNATLRILSIGLLLGALVGCASSPIADVSRMNADKVPAALEAASTPPASEASSRQLVDRVASLLSANQATGLDTDTRVAVRASLERNAEELARRGDEPSALEDLALSELPARISVRAGLRAVRLYIDEGERSDGFSLVRRIDQRYPSHAYRVEAGELLWEIADSYANDKSRRLFLFPYSNRAPAVFEYLSTEYPTHPKSDDALSKLASIYEEKRLFEVAIDKHKDLVLWARESPYKVQSEAAIPRLRLADLDGPEYGRDSMNQALRELEAWLAKYPDDENRPEVERTLVDCLQRLADNDMGVARFYRTVRSVTGARQHAARALESAKRAGNEEQLTEIRDFLASLDEIEELGPPKELPDAISPEDILGPGGSAGPAQLAPGSDEIAPRRTPRKTEKAIEEGEKTDTSGISDPLEDPIEGSGDQ